MMRSCSSLARPSIRLRFALEALEKQHQSVLALVRNQGLPDRVYLFHAASTACDEEAIVVLSTKF